jgi:hypothetical protein
MTTGGWSACACSIQNLPTLPTHPPRTGSADSRLQYASRSPRIDHAVSSGLFRAIHVPGAAAIWGGKIRP